AHPHKKKKPPIQWGEGRHKTKLTPFNTQPGHQSTKASLRITPNHRMPAIVDHAPVGGGPAISVFESGAIMMNLAEKTGRFWPQDIRGKNEVSQGAMRPMANQSPKPGECGQFTRLGDPEGGQSE